MTTSAPPRPVRARRNQVAVRAATRAEERIDAALRSYVARLERLVLQGHGAVDRRRIIAGETVELRRRLIDAIADARDAVSEPGALQGAYEQLGPIGWRQRVTEYSREAAAAAERLSTRAARGNISPAELGRLLRSDVAFTTRYQARRIAVSEAFNAGVENDLSRYALDPDVHAVRWVPTSAHPCKVCLTLANSDLYGLGVGVLPLAEVPLPPHPFCRCRRRPAKGISADDVRQAGLRRGDDAVVTPDGLSADQAARLRTQLRHHLTQSAAHPSRRELEAAMSLRQAPSSGGGSGKTPKGVPPTLMQKLRAGTLTAADLRNVDLATIETMIRAEPIEHLISFRGARVRFYRSGVRSSVSFSHEEGLLFRNETLTHNHPSGSPFSIEDVIVAVRYNVREIRAASEGRRVTFANSAQWYRSRRGAHVLRRDAGGYTLKFGPNTTAQQERQFELQLRATFSLFEAEETRRVVQGMASGQIRYEDRIHAIYGRVWRRLGQLLGFRYRFQGSP